jgi:hypothetical protein
MNVWLLRLEDSPLYITLSGGQSSSSFFLSLQHNFTLFISKIEKLSKVLFSQRLIYLQIQSKRFTVTRLLDGEKLRLSSLGLC